MIGPVLCHLFGDYAELDESYLWLALLRIFCSIRQWVKYAFITLIFAAGISTGRSASACPIVPILLPTYISVLNSDMTIATHIIILYRSKKVKWFMRGCITTRFPWPNCLCANYNRWTKIKSWDLDFLYVICVGDTFCSITHLYRGAATCIFEQRPNFVRSFPITLDINSLEINECFLASTNNVIVFFHNSQLSSHSAPLPGTYYDRAYGTDSGKKGKSCGSVFKPMLLCFFGICFGNRHMDYDALSRARRRFQIHNPNQLPQTGQCPVRPKLSS
jgi:hypothetical protein